MTAYFLVTQYHCERRDVTFECSSPRVVMPPHHIVTEDAVEAGASRFPSLNSWHIHTSSSLIGTDRTGYR